MTTPISVRPAEACRIERETRRSPCALCPMHTSGPDPECEDIKTFLAEGLMTLSQAVYQCAWSNGRRCRGAFTYYTQEGG